MGEAKREKAHCDGCDDPDDGGEEDVGRELCSAGAKITETESVRQGEG